MEGGRVVVIPDPWIVHHVLQIADDGRGAKIPTPSGDEWLMHVQRAGETGSNPPEVDSAIRMPRRPLGSDSRSNGLFFATNVRQSIYDRLHR
jgi:hypothetical protein